MSNITHIVPRGFGKVVDLREKFPGMVGRANARRGVVIMLPRRAGKTTAAKQVCDQHLDVWSKP